LSAAALVQANLSFDTVVGTAGDRSLRFFDVEFDLQRTKGKCFVTAYVVAPLLVAFAPVRVKPSRRHEIADALTMSMPMVRLLRDPEEPVPTDFMAAWVEVSVPIPVTDASMSNVGPVPPWVSLPPFMNVAAGVDFIVSTFAPDASAPTERVAAPIFDAGPSSFGLQASSKTAK
jgi:hypothetical protein